MKKTGKYDLEVNFFKFEKKNIKISFLAVKRIGKRFEIKGTLN